MPVEVKDLKEQCKLHLIFYYSNSAAQPKKEHISQYS
jgi:hypothetical protein